jgi:hypothetical protein
MKQNLLLDKSRSQPDQFPLVARNRPALRAFKYEGRSWIRTVRRMFYGHVVDPLRCLQIVTSTPTP